MRWLAGLVTLGVLSSGCSFVLDGEALHAELAVDEDTQVDSAGDVAETLPDLRKDTMFLRDTGEVADGDDAVDSGADTNVDAADTFLSDADISDSGPGDADVDGNETDGGPTDVDVEVPVEAVVRHSGDVGYCILEYINVGALPPCPTSCPLAMGWSLTFDASQSTGMDRFLWRFSVSNEYRITPTTAEGAVVQVTLQPPDCGFLDGAEVVQGRLSAFLEVPDQGTVRVVDLEFSPSPVAQCGTSIGNCPMGAQTTEQ